MTSTFHASCNTLSSFRPSIYSTLTKTKAEANLLLVSRQYIETSTPFVLFIETLQDNQAPIWKINFYDTVSLVFG